MLNQKENTSCEINQKRGDDKIIKNLNKKRKKYVSESEKILKFNKLQQYFAKLPKDKKEEIILISYIKTFFEIYKTLPNIIAIIDRIIEKRATTIFPSSSIFGSSHSTYSEINKVIDLTERKDKILNLYVIAENMLNSLKEKYRNIAIMKYVKKLTVDEIAIQTEKSSRSIYRTLVTINNEILNYLKVKNWSSNFFIQQIGNELWIQEIYQNKLQSQIDNEFRNNEASE